VTGLLWVTWRQHRTAITATAAVVLFVLLTSYDTFDSLVRWAFGALVAVFWGAPLLAKEFEERTYLVAWGQDVSPVRWLAAKCALLASTVAVLAALLDHSQVGDALFGFALGVVAGFVGRTVPAMAVALAGYVLVHAADPTVAVCWALAAALFGVSFLLLQWRKASHRLGAA
jgi:hypothetical protein